MDIVAYWTALSLTIRCAITAVALIACCLVLLAMNADMEDNTIDI